MQIEQRFVADLDRRDLSAWFDNTTPEDVGQLGYWVGYRIAKAYFQNTPDRERAIREMIRMANANDFLADTGWHPGIELNQSDLGRSAVGIESFPLGGPHSDRVADD